jgi:asparagine synthase (glutamine-hydrolysing)
VLLSPMCGIAGIIRVDGGSVSVPELVAMARAIRHRGPDDAGFALIDRRSARWQLSTCAEGSPESRSRLPDVRDTPAWGADVGLAHRRFSIIDLSAGGFQPFVASDGKTIVVFNGELYNYVELRSELASSGHRFRTSSDTEVLAESYLRWGTDCFRRFNGFWSIAIYDSVRRSVILSRDRFGKKPLYWTRVSDSIYFASEIKSLLEVGDVSLRRAVNIEIACDWMYWGVRDHTSETFFSGIQMVPPASWLEVGSAATKEAEPYWSLPRRRLTERQISVAEASSQIRTTLEDAVSMRLRSDVPLAVELSGGMDSSAVAALASRASTRPVTSYTIRFEDPEADEEPFARALAERCGLDYRVLNSPEEEFWPRIGEICALHEEPFHSPNLDAQQSVWCDMRQRGTKVSLGGLGGDEMFAGYPSYFVHAQIDLWRQGCLGQMVSNYWRWTEPRSRFAALSESVRAVTFDLRGHLRSRFGGKSAQMAHWPFLGPARELGVPSGLDNILRADCTITKMYYWLVSLDKSSMGVPIETRAPLLDYRLADLAFTLPLGFMVRDGWHKWIFRKAMEPLLPPEVVWRRRKMGLPYPYARFYRESRPIVDVIIDRADNPFIDLRNREPIYQDWLAIGFLLWYELFFNRNEALFRDISSMARRGDSGRRPSYVPAFFRNFEPALRPGQR